MIEAADASIWFGSLETLFLSLLFLLFFCLKTGVLAFKMVFVFSCEALLILVYETWLLELFERSRPFTILSFVCFFCTVGVVLEGLIAFPLNSFAFSFISSFDKLLYRTSCLLESVVFSIRIFAWGVSVMMVGLNFLDFCLERLLFLDSDLSFDLLLFWVNCVTFMLFGATKDCSWILSIKFLTDLEVLESIGENVL